MTIWAAIHVGIDIPQQHAVHQDHLAGWMFCGFVRAVDLAMPPAPSTWAPRRGPVASLKGPYRTRKQGIRSTCS